jgi:5-oxoprolinase (ATP-hydrolysing) subunit A
MRKRVIDINSDLGESPERLASGADFELMRHITSANIACGGHAGDAETMRQTVDMAKKLDVAIGAHPSYPDRANFGRVESAIASKDLELSVREQILALAGVAEALGARLAHVKPHGALYHATSRNYEIARAVGRAVMSVDPHLIMAGQAGSPALTAWREMGLRCAGEAFADRAYERDGSLRSRTRSGALLDDPEQAARQAVDIAVRHSVTAADGFKLAVAADTICIHSDTPNAAVIARAVSEGLEAAGVQVQALR